MYIVFAVVMGIGYCNKIIITSTNKPILNE